MSSPTDNLPAIQTNAKSKPVLSPFTFNNITLPTIPKPYQSVKLEPKSPPKDTLTVIPEKVNRMKRSRTRKQQRNTNTITRPERDTVPSTQQSKRLSHSRTLKEEKKKKDKSKEKDEISKKLQELSKVKEEAVKKKEEMLRLKKQKEEERKQKQKQKQKQEESKQKQEINKTMQIRRPKRSSHKKSSLDKEDKMNKTIQEIRPKEKEPVSKHLITVTTDPVKVGKKIKYLNPKSNIEQYMKMNLTNSGWQETKQIVGKQAKLLWSNADTPTDYSSLKPGQFYNHIRGSVNLTHKDLLHQQFNAIDKPFYPTSFLLSKEYDQFMQENNNIAVKKMLKGIATEILFHFDKDQVKLQELLNYPICLGQVFSASILQNGNEETKLLVKLCMYLEMLRRESKLESYFQRFKGYYKVNIKPKPHLFDELIIKATEYLDKNMDKYLETSYQHIDYRLLVLILHYNQLFYNYDPSFQLGEFLWIVKPIASSRGAGISILRSTSQFCQREDTQWNQFKNRRKFQNKIVQKYIPNPYLLGGPGDYSGRKFDIRQWVLVICYSNRIIAFKYHTAYCRFSNQKFTLDKLNREIHLTNYHLYREEEGPTLPSVMMLEEFFAATKEDLRGKYVQQSTQIVQETISHCHRLKYQEGCFQLFGFDFLMDSQGKLFLLEVNLNPACASNRYKPLQEETQIMAETMLSLVTETKLSEKWVQVVGPTYGTPDEQEQKQVFGDSVDINVKPFYKAELGDEESLIALIRYRKMVIFRIATVVKKYFWRQFSGYVDELQIKEKKEEGEQTTEKGKVNFVQEFSATTL